VGAADVGRVGVESGVRRLAPGALVVAVCAVASFAVLDKGAFFTPASTVVLVASLCVLAASWLLAARAEGAVRPEDLVLLALAGWWLVASRLHGLGAHFAPLGVSVVGLVAAGVVVRSAPWAWRRVAAIYLVGIGVATSIAGLVGADLRWTPLALRAQDLWRAAGSLTYSNAAGLLVAVALLVATDDALAARWRPLAVAACAAGLVATQSRSAVLAAVVGFALVSRAEFVRNLAAIVMGTLAGLLSVAASAGPRAHPLALAASLAILAVCPLADGAVRARGARDAALSAVARRRTALLAAAGGVLVGVALLAAHVEAARRVDVGSDLGRLHAWRAALDQFASSWLTGVGADRPLAVSPSETTYFAHNEYLQLLAGGGVVALGLLGAAAFLIVRRQRATSSGLPTARAALVALAVGGLFDFTWHLPAIGLLAGIVLGLAQPAPGSEGDERSPRGLRTP